MAFNPFHKFRKHQKVLFAVLTILCMFLFVGSAGMGGGGDLIAWMTRVITGRSTVDKAAEVDGKTITQRELANLYRQREIANMYMTGVTGLVLDKRVQELMPPSAQNDQRAFFEALPKIRSDREVQELEARRMRPLYFGGNLKTEGLIDFLIWQHQADKLGIKLSAADVGKEVNRLTNNRLSPDRRDSGRVEQMIKERYPQGYSGDMLLTALAQEFRAQMAQAAIMGTEPATLGRIPDPITPDEFWSYYKDNLTRLDIRLFPVKAEDFLAQVKEQPTDKELRDLYAKNKDREYSPDSKEPGFKLPRRVQVEWISGKSDSPYYKKAAVELRTLVQITQQVGFGAANLPGAPGIAPALEQSITAGIDPLVVAEYNRNRMNTWGPYLAPSYSRPWWQQAAFSFHDTNVNLADNIATAVGSGAMPMSPVAAVAGLMGNVSYHEIADRAQRGSTWLLAGAGPTPLTSCLAASAVGGELTPTSEFLPISLFREQLKEQILKFLAQDLLAANLKAITKEIESRPRPADKEKTDKEKADKEKQDKQNQESNDAIARMVKQYDLQTGKTTEVRDQFRNKIADDPGLQPLYDAYKKYRDPEGKRFADLFFNPDSKGPFVVERFPFNRFGRPDDDSEWRSAPEPFIFWKTADQPARTAPFDDPDVKKDVERAWRMQKARELAKKDAESLATKAQEEKGDVKKLRDFAVRNKMAIIDLPPIAKMNQKSSGRPDIAYFYQPPEIPEAKVPNADKKPTSLLEAQQLAGKPSEFATKLLALQDKAKGDTLVLHDYPEAVFYVAVLVDKQPPTMDEFFTVYRDAATDAVRRNEFLQDFERERKARYTEEVLKLLRVEAKVKIEPKAIKDMDRGLNDE